LSDKIPKEEKQLLKRSLNEFVVKYGIDNVLEAIGDKAVENYAIRKIDREFALQRMTE